MTVANGEGETAGRGPPVDPFDPVALEARLAAARLRRRDILARRSRADGDARPPAPATAAAAPPQPGGGRIARRWTGTLAAFGLGLLVALPVTALLSAGREPAPVVAVAPAKATVGRTPQLAILVPSGAIVASSAGPAPRPAAQPAPEPAPKAVRSARNAPRAITPPQAIRLLARDLNAATIGRTARALGVRERVAVPGVPLAVTLDRRGLRMVERPVRQHGRR